jgi:hypothetical protein
MSFIVTPTRFVLVVALATSVPALAQQQQPHAGHPERASPAPQAAGAGPTTPAKAPGTRAATYRSAFEGYRGFGDEKPVPWREANDVVGRIGGWRAYAREAQGAGEPEAAASQPGAARRGGHGAHQQR